MDDLLIDVDEDGNIVITEADGNEDEIAETETEATTESADSSATLDGQELIEGSVGFGIFVIGILVGLIVFRTLSGRWHA